MKVLLVNKFLYPKGGAETYVFKLGKALEREGHEVQYFGLWDAGNIVGNRVNAYAVPKDFNKGIFANARNALSIIYNSDARRKMRCVLEDFQPDVVHLNNIHYHLTPSIILECQKYRKEKNEKIKIVYTAHDYQLICPSHGLFDHRMNVCEKCIEGDYYYCFKGKCIKNSYAKSLLGMFDAYFWQHNKAYSYIDTIICCSRFSKKKLDADKRFRGKTIAIHNFVDRISHEPVQKEGYILEFGHLSREKGTYTVLEAAKRMPEYKFVFAGFGDAVEDVKMIPNAQYVGFQTGKSLEMLIRKASVSLCPSEWYENCPFSVIESIMYGTPVIGSDRGGIPELIDSGITGEIFQAGNSNDLEKMIRKVTENESTLDRYAKACLKKNFHTPESYCSCAIGVYNE